MILQSAAASPVQEKELLSSKVMRLEEKVSDLNLRLKYAQSDRERFLQEKLELTRRSQGLSLELEWAQRGREGFTDQVSDLHVELVEAKSQANRQDQEKVQMKEELIMLKQVNEKLTAELQQTQQKLQSTLDEFHHIQAEQKISSNLTAALEAEREKLLGEKELLMGSVEEDEKSKSLQELRSSKEQLEGDRDALHARCQTLEEALEQAHEQLGSQIQEQQQVTIYWKDRWHQAAVSLKNQEEQLEQERAQCQKAVDKNNALLQDCEMLGADTEELFELRTSLNSLKEEHNRLKQQMKEQEQSRHMEHLQSHIAINKNENPEVNLQLKELYSELQQAQ
ncbi:GRIP1-associated protein 1-like [Bombina bombina]|uniref:GRIP1-associated protein 1-like n=1 Tax=Bombina bombina TaxID=8345 RepID=UPI00235B1172|nr:GRIP1-associated protein 1-like [Bombina bombina]